MLGRGLLVVALTLVACDRRPADQPLTPAERAGLGGAIYFLGEPSDAPRVMSISPRGGSPVAVSREGQAAFVSEASPDGRLVALTVDDQLVLAGPDGRHPRVVAQGEGLAWYPRFSPDGQHLLFESSRASFRDLYVVPTNGGAPVRLTDNREGNFDAAWSPDAKQIAFASSRHGQLDLFVMNADGSEQRRLTRHPGDSIRPCWSPDGRYVAFISGRDGRDDLFLIKPDGSELVSLTQDAFTEKRDGAYVERFAFRPDGQAIAFSVRTPRQGSKIWSIDLPTRKARRLSTELSDDADPAWSPDGRFLAFTSVVKERADVWLMEANGRRRTRLTETESAWLPRWLEVSEGSGDS